VKTRTVWLDVLPNTADGRGDDNQCGYEKLEFVMEVVDGLFLGTMFVAISIQVVDINHLQSQDEPILRTPLCSLWDIDRYTVDYTSDIVSHA
jgi:hypothetical protein